MELSDGEVPSSATGDDRISALPDELLLLILLFLRNAAAAARTSVLSRCWRHLWTQLRDLRVPFFPEPVSFRSALGASELRLRYLNINGDGATLESLAIWLPAAARRLSGSLVLVNHARDPEPEGLPETSRVLEEEKVRFEMPCFENAAKIYLDLGFLRAFMPFAGVFAQLTILVLDRVWFCGACLLSDAVSSSAWRCPRLQVLKIRNARGLSDLVINSESLLELELSRLDSLWELTVEAAVLKKLTVVNCFLFPSSGMVSAAVSAPRLVYLDWSDLKGQCSVELGQMPHLQSIGQLSYVVYGRDGTPENSACMKLLQPFKAIESLALALVTMRDLSNCQYLMEDMKVLPNPAILYLNVFNHEHSFGTSIFHVLRMCLGIKKLVLVLIDNVMAEEQSQCLPGCVCDEQPNWKTEGLLLINLQEIEIQSFRGSEHEVSFVKRLLNWATALNKMTVTLSSSTTKSNAKELFQMFKSLSKPEVCMKLMYNKRKKVFFFLERISIRCYMQPEVYQNLKLLFVGYEPWKELCMHISIHVSTFF